MAALTLNNAILMVITNSFHAVSAEVAKKIAI